MTVGTPPATTNPQSIEGLIDSGYELQSTVMKLTQHSARCEDLGLGEKARAQGITDRDYSFYLVRIMR